MSRFSSFCCCQLILALDLILVAVLGSGFVAVVVEALASVPHFLLITLNTLAQLSSAGCISLCSEQINVWFICKYAMTTELCAWVLQPPPPPSLPEGGGGVLNRSLGREFGQLSTKP